MIKTILTIIIGISIFGILIFSFVRRSMQKKIDQLVEQEKLKKKRNKEL